MATAQIFHDHIKELRKRILWVALSVGLSGGLAYVLHAKIIAFIQRPLGSPLFYSSPAGSFNFILELSVLIGLFITLPVIIYHLLRFLEPALPVRIKRKTMVVVISASFIMALMGICFSFFYLLPISLEFFSGYSSDQIKPLISASEYLSFVIGHLATFAVVFQIPLVILFINWITPIKPGKLLKYQRHVIVGAFGMAVVLPFTYDPVSQFIVAVPIVFLFYTSAVLLWFAGRRRRKKSKPAPELAAKPITSSKPVIQAAEEPKTQRTSPANPPMRRRVLSTDGFMVSTISYRPRPIEPPVARQSSRPALQNFRRPQLSIDGFV